MAGVGGVKDTEKRSKTVKGKKDTHRPERNGNKFCTSSLVSSR